MAKVVNIIGAGPGGLAAAMLLSARGMRVRIFERAKTIGGRTTSLSVDGFRFDVGPTFFLYPQVLEQVFSAAGFDLQKEVPLIKLDPQYRLIFGAGGEIMATGNIDRMEQQIAALSPQDANGFRRFMAENRVKLKLFEPCLQSPFLSWRDVVNMRMLKLLPHLRPHKSLYAELSRYFQDPRLRLAFTFQSKYLGMSPFHCPSLFSILSFIEYEYGIFHPVGGCNAITTAMARLATKLGAEIRLDEPVTELVYAGKRVTGVRTANGEFPADATIVNADFARFMAKQVPNAKRRRWNDAKLAKTRFSCSTFMMYLGIRGEVPELQHHNIYITKDYEQNLNDIELHHALSEDPSFYVHNPSRTDPSMAPPGMTSLYVLIPVSHMHPNIDWAVQKEKYRAIAYRQLEKAGLRDAQSRVVVERLCTPHDWESRFEIYKGATFNMAHNLGQMLHLRPRNRFEDLDNVYLVGGGTHPGSGLPVIFESARITAKLIAEDLA